MFQLTYYRLTAVAPLVLGIICYAPMPAIAQTAQSLVSLETTSNESTRANLNELAVNTGSVRSTAASSYLLGPGDRIEVSVYGFPEYTGPLSVLPDGTIALPIVGKVAAAGKTTDQLTQELRIILDRILVDPAVSVSLNSLRPVVVNVSGEVYRPGPIQLQDTTNINQDTQLAYAPPSVSEALVEAGGVRRTADIRSVVVIRELPNGETVNTEINLWDALWSASLPEDMLLRDGDLIFVPSLPEGETIDNHLLARSSLAPDTVRVRVVGEVTSPGEVAVPPNSSLSSAVAIAGGPTDDARLKEVAFIRMDDNTGEVMQEVVDLRNLIDTYQIQDGDVIVVPKTTSGSVLDLAARLVNPLNFLFRLFD
ncbi:periplasmic protein involved in polysaccharide export [Leptolyngbya sp. PCC 7375]|nr:periplasmic protein involved in polysaccharide export [Leptolyngbya sp. PCC 7375]